MADHMPMRRPAPTEPVVGWIVVVRGPGRGSSREVFNGRNALGADPDQLIPLDFGDPAIARRGHAYIVYDNEGRAFFIEDGKQKELVRVNGTLLSETRAIHHGDTIRIGATTMRFVALCGSDFDWADPEKPMSDPASKPEAAMTKPESMAPKAETMAKHEPMMAKHEPMMDKMDHMHGHEPVPGDMMKPMEPGSESGSL